MIKHTRGDHPIITSLLDADFYKFTMGQLVFHRHPGFNVQYELTNRTTRVRLADHVDQDQLREELDHVRSLRFKKSELHYLRGTNEYSDRMFKEDYLDFLASLQMPEYELRVDDGQFHLMFGGSWPEAIYWETIGLSILNELYSDSLMKKLSSAEQDGVYAEGVRRLLSKVHALRKEPGIQFTDFGTRRRFSRAWQQYVCEVLANELPEQFLGTSDTLIAMLLSILPMGTSAHELIKDYAALAGDDNSLLRSSHNQVLKDWWDEYGHGLSIALTDTFGTEFFFQDFSPNQAAAWKGLRQDSGDPFSFGEKALAYYRRSNVDPASKLIVFSDGLELPTILQLNSTFGKQCRATYGWGTNLTNDLGFDNLSIVIKAAEANGQRTVKLSDNLAKAMGSPEDIRRYKEVFGHSIDTYVECKR